MRFDYFGPSPIPTPPSHHGWARDAAWSALFAVLTIALIAATPTGTPAAFAHLCIWLTCVVLCAYFGARAMERRGPR